MVTRVATLAFEGVETRPDRRSGPHSRRHGRVQHRRPCGQGRGANRVSAVRSAMAASGLALPAKRITVNLAPADLPKEGSHYDLPIALAVMVAIGAIPADALDGYAVLGELALDGDDQPRSPACCRRRSPPTRGASASSAPSPAAPRRPGPRRILRCSRRAR